MLVDIVGVFSIVGVGYLRVIIGLLGVVVFVVSVGVVRCRLMFCEFSGRSSKDFGNGGSVG